MNFYPFLELTLGGQLKYRRMIKYINRKISRTTAGSNSSLPCFVHRYKLYVLGDYCDVLIENWEPLKATLAFISTVV